MTAELIKRVNALDHELHSRIGDKIDGPSVLRWMTVIQEVLNERFIEPHLINQKLDEILARLGAVKQQESYAMTSIKDVQDQADKAIAAITAESSKDDAIIALVTANTAQITSLKDQLSAAIAANDPTALQAVLDSLTAAETSALSNAQRVTEAVNANTITPTP